MDRGKHFVVQVLTHIFQALGITQNLHVPYSPSAMPRNPPVLATNTLQGLDPHSLSLDKGDMVLSSYLSALHKRLQTLWTQSGLIQTLPLEEALHPFEPGDWVWIKFFTRTHHYSPGVKDLTNRGVGKGSTMGNGKLSLLEASPRMVLPVWLESFFISSCKRHKRALHPAPLPSLQRRHRRAFHTEKKRNLKALEGEEKGRRGKNTSRGSSISPPPLHGTHIS
ncbi:hypothetical protein L345_17730, partial [Ophiophagus hannah]